MLTFLGTLFAWPQGIVVGNLIASAIWATPALIHLHWRHARHTRALRAEIASLRYEVRKLTGTAQ